MEKNKFKITKHFSNYKCKINNYFNKRYSNYTKERCKINSKSCDRYEKISPDFLDTIKYRIITKGREKSDLVNINSNNKDGKEEQILYVKQKQIGKGAFGICYIYESTKDFVQYAAKVISKKNATKDEKYTQSIVSEIKTLQSLDSPKIVKIKSYSEDNENVYIIQELCKNKSLSDLLEIRDHLTEFEVQNYMFQLIQGLKYLHDKNIIHRDLKPNNLFLDEKLELKIGDFGLIAKLDSNKDRKKSCCGTPYYMAPEVINPGEKGYSFEVDIWSIGIIMYKLLTGKVPFGNKNDNKNEIYKDILKGDLIFPENSFISESAKDLITQILVKEPRKRPGLIQILYHDFFHMNTFPEYLSPKFYSEKPTLEEMPKINNFKPSNQLLYKLIVNDVPEIKYKDIKKFQFNNSSNNKIENWVSFFHESHYGFCYYEMNNGLIGAIFKDKDSNFNGLKLIFNSDTDIIYEIENDEEEDKINSYKAQNCPERIKEQFKVFTKYNLKMRQKRIEKENKLSMNPETKENSINISTSSISSTSISLTSEENSIQSEEITETEDKNKTISTIDNNSKEKENKKEKKLIYIRKYNKDDNAKFLLLSTGTKQIIFKDKIEIILSEEKEAIAYVDRKKKMTFLRLINIMKNCNKDLLVRLKYIKQANYKDIKDKLIKKIENNEKNKNENNDKNDNNDGGNNNYFYTDND